MGPPTRGKQHVGPLPAAVEATTRMKLLCQVPSFQDGGARLPIAVKGCRYAARFARPCRATVDCAAAARGSVARRARAGSTSRIMRR